MDLCRNCPEEKECIELRKELHRLQKENYEKQRKRKNKSALLVSAITDTAGHSFQLEQESSLLSGESAVQQMGTTPFNQAGAGVYFVDEEFDDEMDFDECDVASLEAFENMEYGDELVSDREDGAEYSSRHLSSVNRGGGGGGGGGGGKDGGLVLPSRKKSNHSSGATLLRNNTTAYNNSNALSFQLSSVSTNVARSKRPPPPLAKQRSQTNLSVSHKSQQSSSTICERGQPSSSRQQHHTMVANTGNSYPVVWPTCTTQKPSQQQTK